MEKQELKLDELVDSIKKYPGIKLDEELLQITNTWNNKQVLLLKSKITNFIVKTVIKVATFFIVTWSKA